MTTTTRPRYGLTLSAPGAEPLTTAEAKTHLRVGHANDDTYIDTLVKSARIQAENFLNRALITQVVVMTLDCFPAVIEVPRPPMDSTEPTITYLDENGDSQTLATSKIRLNRALEPAIITPAEGETWPNTQPVTGAVTVQVSAGYGGSGSDVPAPIIHAIKILVGHYYAHREPVVVGTSIAEMPQSAMDLLWPYRIVPT